MRGALFTAVVAEVISCSFTRREVRCARCCGVYPADEARLLREQPLRKAGQEQLVLMTPCLRRRRTVRGTCQRHGLVGWWTPPAAAGKKHGCLLRGYRELALLDACQTAPAVLAR